MTEMAPSPSQATICADLRAWIRDDAGVTGPVGGFMGLDLDTLPKPPRSLLHHWVGDAPVALGFHNIRSALVHLIKARAPNGTVWLPAYTCPSLPAALEAHGIAIAYYPITPDLAVAADAFNAVDAHDALVLMNYFGKPAVLGTALDCVPKDCLVIEDGAHTIETGKPAQAPWRLYSARKMVGVPDGGLLVGYKSAAASSAPMPDLGPDLAPAFKPLQNISFMSPVIARGEDPAARFNGQWYADYQDAEANALIGDYPISRLSAALLTRIDAQMVIKRRHQNYRTLAEALSTHALWPEDLTPDWVPFCFPILVPDAARFVAGMADLGVFVPRYWAHSPAPQDNPEFSTAHDLAQRLVGLPCDHRYEAAAMHRVIDAVHQTLPPSR
ncbi:MAG: hypothetical protein AAF213_05275 [Pseudomonadota bacterium]